MIKITINGSEGMDPMGVCESCSNEQISLAVEYIVLQTK